MANNYSKILELADKNNMGLSNTIKRDYGIPLDYSSIQETYEAALNYAKTSTLAYIGQPISVGDTLYIVTDEAGGWLKAVGSKPAGDDKSIAVGEDGKITIKGFSTAPNATLPRKKADGTIEWVAIDAIVAGDGNTKTIVKVADDSALTITALEDAYDSETDTYTYILDVTLPAIPEYSVTKETGEGKITYTFTKDGAAVGEAIEVPNAYNDTVLIERVTKAEASIVEHGGRLDSVEEKVDTFFATVENPDEVVDTLAEIQKYITDDKTGAAGMAASIKENKDALEVLNGTAEGSIKSKIDAAISAKAAEDAGKYATQDALAEVSAKANAAAVKTEVEAALANKVNSTALDNYYTKNETYTKQEVGSLLDGITGGSSETAASVKRQLDDHIADNATSFSNIDKKDSEQDTAIQANTDAIAAINDETTGILAKAKAAAETDAQAKVNALAETAVAQNTSDISAINGKIEGINNNISTFSNKISDLESKDTILETAIEAEKTARETLSTTVADHTTAITELKSKDTSLEALIAANTAKFDNYSTTEEVDQAIEDKIASIDYTGITEAVSANTKAITDEAERAKAAEEELAGLISANSGTIENNTAEIARVNNVLVAALDNNAEGLDSIKELATWIEEHDKEVLPVINANTAAIGVLNGTGEGSVKKTVEDAIAAISVASALETGVVKASDEVTVAADGTMGIGLVSTDKLIQGSNTLVLNGGSANITH